MSCPTDALAGRLIFVAEDEYLLAEAIVAAIQSAGGGVLGPFESVAAGLSGIASGPRPADAATLNVNLVDGESYLLADELVRRGIPFTFASGSAERPDRFARVPMIAKPYSAHQIVQGLMALLETPAGASV